MAIFNSYVSLPEGNAEACFSQTTCTPQNIPKKVETVKNSSRILRRWFSWGFCA